MKLEWPTSRGGNSGEKQSSQTLATVVLRLIPRFQIDPRWTSMLLIAWVCIILSWLYARSDGLGGRVLTVAWSYDPGIYDPHRTSDPIAYSVFRHVCEPLFFEGYEGHLHALLAQDAVTYDDFGRRLLVKIRPGTYFHDGTPLDAYAVEFSYRRIQAFGISPLQHSLQDVVISALDADTVEFLLPNPDYDFARLVLSNPYAAIVSNGIDQGDNFVSCTGPFKYVDDLYRPGEQLTLVRFPKYHWPPAYFENHGISQIHWLSVYFQEDRDTRFQMLLNGDLCVLSLNTEQAESIYGLTRYKIYNATGGLTYLGFNFLKPFWQNVDARQAVAMALDHKELATVGPFDPATTPLSPATTGYDSRAADSAYTYAPLQSEQLLVRADVARSNEITLLFPESSRYRELAKLVAMQLAEVGFTNVRLREVDRSEISRERQNFDLLLYDYAWGDYTALSIFLGSGPHNLLHYPNQDVSSLIQTARTTADPERRQELILDAQRIILSEVIWQPLLIRNLAFAVDSRCVEGIRQSPFSELLIHDARTQ